MTAMGERTRLQLARLVLRGCNLLLLDEPLNHLDIEGREHFENALDAFESSVLAREEVMECYLMTGDADYLLRVVVPDMPSLERFIVDYLARIPGVSNIRSSFALKQVKYKTALPLPKAPARASGRKAR